MRAFFNVGKLAQRNMPDIHCLLGGKIDLTNGLVVQANGQAGTLAVTGDAERCRVKASGSDVDGELQRFPGLLRLPPQRAPTAPGLVAVYSGEAHCAGGNRLLDKALRFYHVGPMGTWDDADIIESHSRARSKRER